MTNPTNELVISLSKGIDSELSSAAFTLANGAQTEGMKVYVFLTSAGVDLVRKKGVDLTTVDPLDPLKALMVSFLERGGTIWACPPCVAARGYTQENLIDGAIIAGASAMFGRLKGGAASLSF